MLKMKKMNGLKIFALVLLSLNKFETMFGMKKDEKEDNINDEYVNKNYYLIDDLGHKITLDKDEDIKFKIYSQAEMKGMELNKGDNDILEITEENSNKILVSLGFNKEGEKICGPIFYKNGEVITRYTNDQLHIMFFEFTEEGKKEYEDKVIHCRIVKKIGEDSIDNDYILVDAKDNKIEKIKNKNIVFKILTRKKFLELKEKINKPENFLKNDEGKYILDDSQKPLLFEEEENYLILYVRRLKNNLCLAWLLSLVTPIKFNKNNSIEVRMAKKEVEIAKKEELLKVEKKEEDDDSSKCCCGIC